MKPNRRERTDLLTVVLHWATVLVLGASFVTGLRISADNPDATVAQSVAVILPQGDVFRWHVWAGYALALVSIAYVAFVIIAGVRARIAFKQSPVKAAVSGSRTQRLRALNVTLYWCGFGLLFVSLTSGVLHYLMPPFVPQESVLTVHRFSAWLFLVYIVLHVAAQFAHGGIARLLKIIRPRPAYGIAAMLAAVIAGVGGVAVYAVERSTLPELRVATTVPETTTNKAKLKDVLSKLEPVRVHTVRGANHDEGEVTVEIKAAEDGLHLYTQFSWPDETRSQKHLPLVKTDTGWKVQQTEFGRQDEDFYYEDKFAVMWGDSLRNAASGTAHMGEKPLDNRPGPAGGRGLHYTTDGEIVDVWHWKSVRTGSSATQQIDDNYFGPPMEVDPDKSRYTGGYTQDPSPEGGGGYSMNWESYSDDRIVPKYLPRDTSVLDRMGSIDLNPHVSDDGEFYLKKSETIPYSASADSMPVGTVMPSVILEGRRQGDRGDVHAESVWEEGRWTMTVKRKLDTGSEYDVAFDPNGPLYLWVAAFDHSQTRHSYHVRPIEVVFERSTDQS